MEGFCGLDIHKDSVFMCILKVTQEKIEGVFGTSTPELERLRLVLLSHCVAEVAMESTSIYWVPVWRMLESDFEVKLVNPYFIRQLPGRKTDVKDAQWIATVLQKGLIKASFIPDDQTQQLRQYNRKIFCLNKQKQRAEQGVDLILQRCNIRLSNYVSDIGGKSMRKVVRALAEGFSDPDQLVKLVHARITNKHGIECIRDALKGIVSTVDTQMLLMSVQEIELFENQLAVCKQQLLELCRQFHQQQLELLQTIPGIKEHSAASIIAEIGVDMKAFLTASALVGWAGLRPRNDESAGKIKGRKTLHGNKYLRVMLVQCAWAASRTRSSRFQLRYDKLKKRMNHNKALIANARKILVVIWHILEKKRPYVANAA